MQKSTSFSSDDPEGVFVAGTVFVRRVRFDGDPLSIFWFFFSRLFLFLSALSWTMCTFSSEVNMVLFIGFLPRLDFLGAGSNFKGPTSFNALRIDARDEPADVLSISEGDVVISSCAACCYFFMCSCIDNVTRNYNDTFIMGSIIITI